MSTTPNIRPDFISKMQKEINANAYKGNWEEFTPTLGMCDEWMHEHTAKLMDAIYFGDAAKVSEYAADVANIAMKIEERFGQKPA